MTEDSTNTKNTTIDPMEGLSKGTLALSKQDTDRIIEGLFTRLSDSGIVPSGHKPATPATQATGTG